MRSKSFEMKLTFQLALIFVLLLALPDNSAQSKRSWLTKWHCINPSPDHYSSLRR